MTSDGADRSPYVGPRPFTQADQDVFFGRDAEVARLVSLVIAHRLVLLYAVSGAGKTSLLTAGVVPALVEQGFEILPFGRLQSPVAPPQEARNAFTFAALSGMVADRGGDKAADLKMTLGEFLAAEPRGEDDYGFPRPRLLVLDQFEEFFNVYQDRWHQREEFLLQLAQALEEDSSLRVLISIREDYLAQMDRYAPQLPDGLRTRFHLERLREPAALAAVRGPLAARRVEFAPGVAETLIHDLQETRVDLGGGQASTVVGEFVEPVHLQVVCEALWTRLGRDAQTVTEDDLVRLGSVDDSLIRFYETAVAAAAVAGRVSEHELRETLERSFVTSAGTRATVFAAAEESGRLPAASLDVLAARHVIRAEWRAGGRWLELAHDRLIEPLQTSNARAREARRARLRRRALVLGSAVAVILLIAVASLLAVAPEDGAAEGCADARGAQMPASCSRTPDIVGAASASEAEQQLRAEDLNLGPVSSREEADVDPGTVIAQSPAAGSIVNKGDSVRIEVAVGLQNVRVPQLRDLKLEAADERLRSAGLVRGSVSGGPEGAVRIVQGQIPAAGDRVKRGTAVDLFLRGQRPPAPPDLFVQTLGIDAVGRDVVVTIAVRNLGRGNAPRFIVVAGSPQLATERRTVNELAAGRSRRMEIHMPYTARARLQPIVVFVTVDPEGRIRERNEDNNGDRTAPLPPR